MKNIAIDMGGTRVKVGLFDRETLLSTEIIPACAQENFGKTIENIDNVIGRLMKQHNIPSIQGIGLSIPGLVNTKENKVISINEKYNDSVHFNLNQWAKSKWDAILATENDARAALAGEWKKGAGKGIDNLVMMTLGTGIGGAAMIEGKLLHGKHYQAGCLGGHFTIDFQGRMCNCGNRGCVETKGSSWVLPELAVEYNYKVENISFEMLFNDMRNGNPAATKMLDMCVNAWSACAVNLIHAYDPEMLIIGGGVMKSADIILPKMKTWIDKYAWTPWGKVELKTAQLEDTAALYGMNYLIGTLAY